MWRFHGQVFLPRALRATVFSLAQEMRTSPAFVDAGGVTHLCRGTFVTIVNVALTYSVIALQYRK